MILFVLVCKRGALNVSCVTQDGDLKAIDFDSACAVAGGTASGEPEVVERVGCRFETDYVLTPRYDRMVWYGMVCGATHILWCGGVFHVLERSGYWIPV